MNEQPDDKIRIDEEWKAKVEAEKQAFAAQEKLEQEDKGRPPLPPASLAMLVTNFATQALVCLGRIPDPTGAERELDLEMARYAIDMLEVIETKTAGNVEDAEKQMLASTLHDLRMTYLSVAKSASGSGESGGSAEGGEQKKSRIITP